MLISDQHQFALIHIPKCAGTTLRHALEKYDERREIYYQRGVTEHPVLGQLDYHHLPLSVVRQYFPQDFRCLETYRTYAVARRPSERFPSSLAQHVLMYHGEKLDRMSDRAIGRALDTVIRWLSRNAVDQPVLDPEYIHFARQRDYTHLEGSQLVRNVYPLERVDLMVERLSDVIGEEIGFRSLNRRVQFGNPIVDAVSRSVQGSLSRVLPRDVWMSFSIGVRDRLMLLGLVQPSSARIPKVLESSEVKDFVRDYYREDISLYEASVRFAEESG